MRGAAWTLAAGLIAAPIHAQSQVPVPLAFEASLNGEPRGTVLLLQQGDVYLLGEDDARVWRLRLPAAPTLRFRGQAFHALSTLGLTVSRLETEQQRIDLRAEPSAFEDSTARLANFEYRLTPAAWGGFLAYDFVGTRLGGRSVLDAAFTVSAFGPYGSLSHQVVARNLWASDDSNAETSRIATTFRRDWPERLVSFEAGDTVSRPGAFGNALRFGGLSAGSNFSLRPGFIRQPLPDLTAETSLPSTVQVFVQNQLRSVAQVPPGRFTLDNVPVILGAGEARLVVRDALGREQVVTSSFYIAGGLLKKGLSEWYVGAGKLRSDFGGDAEYGASYGSGLFRYGLTNAITVEGRAEFEGSSTRVVGAAVNLGGLWGEIEGTLGVADVEGVGQRWLGGVGYRYVTLDYNVGARWVEAQRGFRQPGETAIDPTPVRTITASAGARLGERWSAGLSWIGIERQSGFTTNSANVSATFALRQGASLLFAYNRVSEGGQTRDIGSVLLSMALGARTTASAGADSGSDKRLFAAVQRSLPFDEGWGYRAAVNRYADRTRFDAGAALNLRPLTASVEVNQETGQSLAARVGAAGSFALVEDTPFAVREITDSFALVRVPGVAGVPIFLNNQPAGSTDAAGRLVLPRLAAYVPSQVRVDVDALPPDAEIVRDRETAVPPYRSGVVVTLGVRRTAAALVKVVDADGKPIATGAAVRVEPEGDATSVAQGGAFFLRAEPGRKRATITLRGEPCTIEFDVATTDLGAYRTLGPYTCAR